MTATRVTHGDVVYDVVLSSLAESMPKIRELAGGRTLPLVSDRRVFELHGGLLAGLTKPILVPTGETAKDWSGLRSITNGLARQDVKRGTPIIALGGGSIGDVAGLAACLFKRGCPIVHIPTTLLAQVDSAIGGKTAINACGQKNLVGAFHHPALVVVDPSLLDTLDERQLRSGYAEIVKYGLIDSPDFFAWCEDNARAILSGDGPARGASIEHCVKAKARFVSADPDDTAGKRALLNFGHSFGHAIEALARGRLLHGEAVAVGMTLAFRFSAGLGLCPRADAERVRDHLQSIGLPTAIQETGLLGSAVFGAMLSDKKATANGLTLILTRGIGQAFVTNEIEGQTLAEFLAKEA